MTTMKTGELDNLQAESRPEDSETAVVFRGDGEPASPGSLLSRLAEVEAESGFDVDSYSLGGSVAKLEEYFAEALGKEAAIFMPTGALANHLAIRALCGGRRRAIVQEQSHLYQDSGDCVTQLSGINLVPLGKGSRCFDFEELKGAVNESTAGRVLTPIGAMMIESPVRRQQGQVVTFQEMKEMTEYCRANGIHTHLDGARLYMMSAASGTAPQEYAALFDTVYVSLYKYFGAPFGAILAGDSKWTDGMYHTRRMFGGGLSHAYFAAAVALQGAQGFEARFNQAMAKGRQLFDSLNALDRIRITEFEHGSNIFPMTLDDALDHQAIVNCLRERDIFVYASEAGGSISSLSVNTTILRQPNDRILTAFKAALDGS